MLKKQHNFFFSCFHKSKHAPLYNIKTLLCENPTKRTKNTNCGFQICLFVTDDDNQMKMTISNIHKHPLHSLSSKGFKEIPPMLKEYVNSQFDRGIRPANAYPCQRYIHWFKINNLEVNFCSKFWVNFSPKKRQGWGVGVGSRESGLFQGVGSRSRSRFLWPTPDSLLKKI